MNRALLPWLGCLPVLLLSLWLAGTWDYGLLSRTADIPGLVTGRFYDEQAAAALRGALDVPCDSLLSEAVVIDGRCTGYFGLTPSLLRAPLNAVCPSCAGQWNRLSMVGGALATYLGCLLLAMRGSGGRHGVAAAFAVAACLGSSLVFIVGNPIAYHEAILWGTAFLLLALWAIAAYAETGSAWLLAAALGAALLSLNSRLTLGLGAALAIGLVLAMGLPRRRSVLGLALLATIAATPILVNQLKFGQVSPPFDKHVTYTSDPQRLALVQGGAFRLGNLGCTLSSYLSPRSIDTYPSYPWVVPAYAWEPPGPLPAGLEACAGTSLENVEPFFAVYYTYPALLVLAAVGWAVPTGGLARRWRRSFVLSAGALAGGVPVLLFSTLTHRYLHDLFPFLVVGAALGLSVVVTLPRGWRWAVSAGVGVLVAVGLHVNLAAVFDHGLAQPEAAAHVRILQRALPFVVRW
ncbi:hypothetical protein [Azospirillum sp. sgz301742]